MPYISSPPRSVLNATCLGDIVPGTAGELNYCITQLIKGYLFGCGEKFGYKDLNNVLGALEGAKLEFYRRIVVPYENTKMAENGDIY